MVHISKMGGLRKNNILSPVAANDVLPDATFRGAFDTDGFIGISLSNNARFSPDGERTNPNRKTFSVSIK